MAYPGPQDQDGQPYPHQPSQPYGQHSHQPPLPAPAMRNWAGVVGLCLGILALLLDVTMVLAPVGIWMSLVAIFMSGLGMSHARAGTATNRTLSIVAVILSWTALELSIAVQSVWRSI
ncbi:hypothetical protein AB0C33_06685 [Nonomuraea sp. NPDC048881]|uniref:hypothetical protein n=1 Tax=Nonomuraea sp. NPDC048881 TaxID=3155030 RepID=UPI0033C03513